MSTSSTVSPSLERLQTAVDAAGVGTWDFNPTTGELVWSARCKEIFGFPLDEDVTYEQFMAGVHPDDRAHTAAAVAQALDPAGPGTYDITYRTRWAEPGQPAHHARATGRVFFDESRTQAQRFIGTITDVTAQRRTQQELREREADFSQLADGIAQLAWMAEPNGYIFWYNKRWYDYTGATLPEMQGDGWRRVHHPDFVQGVVERISHAFATGTEWEDTFPLRGADGEYRWFLSRAVPLRDAHGEVVRWLGTNTDVTAMRQLQDQLERAYQDLEVKVTFRTLELERQVRQLQAQLAAQG